MSSDLTVDQWSPEPWEDTNPGAYFDDIWGAEKIGEIVLPEDRRRIVACVNACAGIPTEALESGALRTLLVWAESCACDDPKHTPDDIHAALRALGRLP